MGKMYKIRKLDGAIVQMSYKDVCADLGFAPNVQFVEVTNRGTISFTVGKPYEIKALLSACSACGFVPSARLRRQPN